MPILVTSFACLLDAKAGNLTENYKKITHAFDRTVLLQCCIVGILASVMTLQGATILPNLQFNFHSVLNISSLFTATFIFVASWTLERAILKINYEFSNVESKWAWQQAIRTVNSWMIAIIGAPFFIFYILLIWTDLALPLVIFAIIFHYFCIKAIFSGSAKVNEKLLEKQSAQRTALSQ